jgi:dTDP-4-dehydrorhamnose reductase
MRQENGLSQTRAPLELWGGVECTINRVSDHFFDQLHRSGHRNRALEDLGRFHGLGLRTLRTGLHWEHFSRTRSWHPWDLLLEEMDRLQIRAIAGLVHHGSGPPETSLLDPEFPAKLASYAQTFARRYPHILDYTPVNEPQTTARFACLYGYWYPHQRGMRHFVRAMYHQVKGIVLAMRALRAEQPGARLIHTEDGGATFSTPPLEARRLEREHRRWLGTDLLCGLITRDHPLFAFLRDNGLSEHEIFWFSENPCPPSVLGWNYYVTSDRYLDHRLDLYPFPGGGDTGSEPLVDAEAVRARPEGIRGAGATLCEAWDRYRLPVAITEAHLGCDELEQTRWLAEVWREAQSAREDGVDVRAVTAWALLGSFDWSNLCTRDAGVYEPGVFDISSGVPVPTSVTHVLSQLASGLPLAPSASEQGWWRHPSRMTIPMLEEVRR